jgi:hypothetical protein
MLFAAANPALCNKDAHPRRRSSCRAQGRNKRGTLWLGERQEASASKLLPQQSQEACASFCPTPNGPGYDRVAFWQVQPNILQACYRRDAKNAQKFEKYDHVLESDASVISAKIAL